MKKGTEIKIEMAEDGTWRAESPDYEGWQCEGKDSFGSADIAARDLERWTASNTCPICGRRYSAPPATSSVNGADICPVCGAAESVFFLGEEDRQKIVDEIERREIEAGRVEPICTA